MKYVFFIPAKVGTERYMFRPGRSRSLLGCHRISSFSSSLHLEKHTPSTQGRNRAATSHTLPALGECLHKSSLIKKSVSSQMRDQGWGVSCMKQVGCCRGHFPLFSPRVSLKEKTLVSHHLEQSRIWVEVVIEMFRYTQDGKRRLLSFPFHFWQMENGPNFRVKGCMFKCCVSDAIKMGGGGGGNVMIDRWDCLAICRAHVTLTPGLHLPPPDPYHANLWFRITASVQDGSVCIHAGYFGCFISKGREREGVKKKRRGK